MACTASPHIAQVACSNDLNRYKYAYSMGVVQLNGVNLVPPQFDFLILHLSVFPKFFENLNHETRLDSQHSEATTTITNKIYSPI